MNHQLANFGLDYCPLSQISDRVSLVNASLTALQMLECEKWIGIAKNPSPQMDASNAYSTSWYQKLMFWS